MSTVDVAELPESSSPPRLGRVAAALTYGRATVPTPTARPTRTAA